MTPRKENDKNQALRIEQVAFLCGVSVARVQNWIEKNGLKVVTLRKERKVMQDDLVDFLLHFNMPIPKTILPLNTKKILFVGPTRRGMQAGQAFYTNFAKRIGTFEHCITDSVAYGKSAEYKILTFVPDLILIDAVSTVDEALQLIKFTSSVGAIPTIALVRRNLVARKRSSMLAAGVFAVVSRNGPWSEFNECLKTLFNSSPDTPRLASE